MLLAAQFQVESHAAVRSTLAGMLGRRRPEARQGFPRPIAGLEGGTAAYTHTRTRTPAVCSTAATSTRA